MVSFLPFPGYRPRLTSNESVKGRISPPYDVISSEYLKTLQSNENNITNLTLKQDCDKRYHESRKKLDIMIKNESLLQDSDSFYFYQQSFDDHGTVKTRCGLVGILRTEDYAEGNIIPHEETFSEIKSDRLNLLRDMEAHLESIFGIVKGLSPEIMKDIDCNCHLIYRYVDDQGVEHRYSRISDKTLTARITEELKDRKMLIADGHHRYETARAYAKENPDDEMKQYVLATIVADDDEGLVIWPTHRLVKAGDIGEKTALKKISKTMNMTEVPETKMESELKNHMMALMFKTGKCFLADPKDPEDDIMMRLDTYVAQQRILKGIYKSDEGKSKIYYDAELDSVKKKMSAKEYDVAIIFNNPSLSTIWELCLAGKKMPKKTTFFFPKIWSGFVIYSMCNRTVQ